MSFGDEPTDFSPQKLVMGDDDDLPDGFQDFFYDAAFLEDLECDGPACPPPLFLVPPPPRPPDIGEGCPALSPHESCDNIVIIDSQVHLEETFQNLVIVAVCSAILVILLVLLVACIWRKRKSGSEGCHCGDGKQDGVGGGTLPAPHDHLEMKACSEVYDNPNYSHIMIGGKPFFILPTGELSEHVPVPAEGEQHTPRHAQPQQNHIYEGGSSTYRSGSDYDTESSTYRPDSDRASNGFPPIYEEIGSTAGGGGGGSNRNSMAESHFGKPAPGGGTSPPLHTSEPKGFVPHHQTMAVIRKEESLPQTILHPERGGGGVPWAAHKSLSPRRPATRLPNRTPDSSGSVYYYSDTLRRRGLLDSGGRDSVQESDSGVSCRSGHNTSSESTPQPRQEVAGRRGGAARHAAANVVVSSDEDLSQDLRRHRGFAGGGGGRHLDQASPAHHGQVNRRQEAPTSLNPVDTQIIVRNTSKREPRANL